MTCMNRASFAGPLNLIPPGPFGASLTLWNTNYRFEDKYCAILLIVLNLESISFYLRKSFERLFHLPFCCACMCICEGEGWGCSITRPWTQCSPSLNMQLLHQILLSVETTYWSVNKVHSYKILWIEKKLSLFLHTSPTMHTNSS